MFILNFNHEAGNGANGAASLNVVSTTNRLGFNNGNRHCTEGEPSKSETAYVSTVSPRGQEESESQLEEKSNCASILKSSRRRVKRCSIILRSRDTG